MAERHSGVNVSSCRTMRRCAEGRDLATTTAWLLFHLDAGLRATLLLES